MKHLTYILLLSTVVLLGCHKKEAPQNAPSAESAGSGGAQAPAPAPVATPSVATRTENAVQQNVTGEVNAGLTAALRAYVKKNGKVPGSFAEFSASGLDSVPRPPDGKKWAIDAASVQVKAVPSN